MTHVQHILYHAHAAAASKQLDRRVRLTRAAALINRLAIDDAAAYLGRQAEADYRRRHPPLPDDDAIKLAEADIYITS